MIETLLGVILPPGFSAPATVPYNGKVRVCVEKSSGKLIEMQSHAQHETLISNAIAAGYAEDAIEVIEETQQEFDARLAAIPKEPQPKTQTEILQEQIITLTQTLADLMLEGGM